jgi:hypothetical protein
MEDGVATSFQEDDPVTRLPIPEAVAKPGPADDATA